MKDKRRVIVFDTTLRDGQQCPGAGMSFEKNLEYAELAKAVGVDVLEAGFPSASKLDFSIVQTIAEQYGPDKESPVVAALCQLREEQVDKTIEALLPAAKYGRGRMHVYLPVGQDLMRASLGDDAKDLPRLIKNVNNFCKKAVQAGLEVEFSPEGYSRMGEMFDFVTDLIRAAIEAGATTINCPDTVGGASRFQGEEFFVQKMKRHAEIIEREYPGREIIWSAHCHNDFGLAVENTIAAVFEGPVRQIEGCFNGIGERAGNASLEQCIMIIKQFGPMVNGEEPLHTNINTAHLQRISDFVKSHMLPRQPHSPVTGDNAAKHSSGGHTNAVLRNPLIYQPFDPKEVGKQVTMLFGPLSGGNHAKSIIQDNGYRCEENEKTVIAQFIKELYQERRKGITDDEFMRGYFLYRRPIDIEEFDYWRTKDNSELIMQGKFFGKVGELREVHQGKDSALATLKQAIDREFEGLEIESYHSESIGAGIHAKSLSTIVVRDRHEKYFEGKGEDQDIGKSAMKALISATNYAYIYDRYALKEA